MKKPARTWGSLIALGFPLLIVGFAAMMISFATLIDVARINGLPFPIMFPILIDVGMVQAMIVASHLKLRGLPGRWLAYIIFGTLSVVSIIANSTHSLIAADMTITTPLGAALIAATPPATLLGITHLVMMLIPDEKERQRLSQIKEKQTVAAAQTPAPPVVKAQPQTVAPASHVAEAGATALLPKPNLELVQAEVVELDEVEQKVIDWVQEHGEKPTGRIVGEWLGGKSPKTGQRFLAKLDLDAEEDNESSAFPAAVGSRA